jgi:hypothetical protein
MNSTLIKILMIFLVAILTTNIQAVEKMSPLVKRIWPSILIVSTYDREGRTIKQGMGFFAGKEGDVITNRDLLKGAYRVEVRTINGMLYPVRTVLSEDPESDLIRLGVEIPSYLAQPLPVSSSLPRMGERVFAVNRIFPEKPASGGIVTGISEVPGFGRFIQLSPTIFAEVSGSPIVNMSGEVIGVVTSRRIKGQTLNFIIPGEKVLKLKAGRGKTLSEWEAGREHASEEVYATGLPLLWKGDYREALTYFKEAAQKNRQNALAHFQIGYCYDQLGKPREAIEAYKNAIQIKPDLVLAHFFLGLAYLEARERNHALEEYRVLKELDEDYANDLYNMIY